MDGDEGQGNDLKAVAKRRAEQARRAGSHTSESLTKTLYRVFASAGNKLGKEPDDDEHGNFERFRAERNAFHTKRPLAE